MQLRNVGDEIPKTVVVVCPAQRPSVEQGSTKAQQCVCVGGGYYIIHYSMYNGAVSKPIKISRSGLKLFLECPRCFWLDVHHKIKRPPGYPYTLSAAVDYLVKQEFDKYRAKGTLPPVFAKADALAGQAKLYPGEELSTWRNNFKGISYTDPHLNATLYGAVDDVLEFSDGSLAVVDYKSSGSREITIYDDYKKQMDTYNWILDAMGHQTYPQAYFVFYQVDKTGGGFQNVLPFAESLHAVKVDISWVGLAFERAITTARREATPAPSPECVHCNYISNATKYNLPILRATDSDKDYVLVEGD